MRALPRTRSALVAAALLAVLTACSSDELDVDGFAAGACTDLAPTVQDVDEVLRQVGAEDIEPREAGARLDAAQDALKPASEGSGEAAGPVRELITQMGFFRIAVDSNNYDGSQDQAVREALDDVVESCTA